MHSIIARRLLTVLLLVLLPLASRAAQHPNVERGFQPGKLYQVLDRDSVNLFNGNLTIAIPIGLQYANNAGMTQSLALTYNSKLWDFREEFFQAPCPFDLTCDPPGPYELGLPNLTSNAGLGWSVSLGRLISPDDPINDKYLASPPYPKVQGCGPGPTEADFHCESIDWQYESPDGAVTELSPNVAPAGTATIPFNPYGPSAIRMRIIDAATIKLDFMDGSVHTFTKLRPGRGGWRITSIADAFNNTLTIGYSDDDTVWTITDAFGRRTFVNFTKSTSNPQDNYRHLLESIVLPAPNGHTMTYSFTYFLGDADGENEGYGVPLARTCSTHTPDGVSQTVRVPLLKTISIPDHDQEGRPSSFQFTYDTHDAQQLAGLCGDGTIASMTLPTGGTIHWTYDSVTIASSECRIHGWTTSAGVKKRIFTANGVSTEWNYEHHVNLQDVCSLCGGDVQECHFDSDVACGLQTKPRREKKTSVRTPDGNLVEHFFSIIPKDMAVDPNGVCATGDPDMFGQPFTSRLSTTLTTGEKAFLSTILYQKDENGHDVEKRRTYLLYEKGPRYGAGTTVTQGAFGGLFNVRLKAQRTEFHDDNDSFTETLRSDFSAGNYRVEEQRSSFDRTVRRTITDYIELPGADRYILGRYTRTSTQQGQRGEAAGSAADFSETQASLSCFDPANGFLKSSRTIRSKSGTAAAGDVIGFFSRDAHGNVTGEEWGLAIPITPDAICSVISPGEFSMHYVLTHGYNLGIRASSQYAGADFKVLDLTALDPNTGLPLQSRDAAGVLTKFTYDDFGRLRSVETGQKSDGTFDSKSEYRYHNYSSPTVPNAFVEALRSDPVGGDVTTTYVYDLFGRVIRESATMFDGASSVRETTYNALGLQATVSEAGKNAAHAKKSEFFYDAFSRLVSTKTADDKSTKFEYTGIRSMDRTSSIGQTLVNGAIPRVDDAPSTTTETYDGFGRLVAVEEPSNGSLQRPVTSYTYDVGGRLASVAMGVQTRTFHYDAAGFLLSEDHPETASITYENYDARGHAGTKTTGNAPRLGFHYDSAERLLEVDDLLASRPVQKYLYQSGRMQTATRFNYFGSLTYTVADSFTYDDSGRVSAKETVITRSDEPGQPVTFKNDIEYKYTALSLPSNVPYPACTGCGGLSLPPRALTLQYAHGALTGVDGFASLTYHPSGLVASLQHFSAGGAALVRDEQTEDPSGRARPKEISFSGIQECSVITTQPVDTAVNPSTGKATFTVAASGNGITVQWYQGRQGETAIPVGAGLSFTTPALTNETRYWCRVTDTNGCATDSMTVTARVCQRVGLSEPLADESHDVVLGTTVTPHVVASGTSVRYDWSVQVNTSAGPGLPAPYGGNTPSISYQIDNPNATAIILTVRVWGGCDATDYKERSFTYHITPAACSAPLLELDLPSSWILFGDAASMLQISVQGMLGSGQAPDPSYTYQWYRNGQAVPGGSASTLAVSAAVPGSYFAKVTHNCSANSKSETLSSKTYVYRWGTCDLPAVTVDQQTIVLPSANRKFIASCDHPGTQYQWYSGQLGDTRAPVAGQPGHPEEFEAPDYPGVYWLRASLDCGTTRDLGPFVVKRSDCSPVFIARHPQSADIAAGTSVTLSVDANGNPAPYLFQWYEGLGDAKYAGSGTRLTVHPLRTTTYHVLASSTCSAADSMPARLRVTSCSDITIDAPPADASIDEGATVELSVQAHALETLRYQWYEGESGDDTHPVAGATSATLSRTPAQTAHYWVRLYFDRENTCAVDSRTVTVYVCRKPVLRSPLPAFSSSWPNIARWVAVDVTGENLTYEWFEGSIGGTPVASEGYMARVQPAQTTRYYVRVTSSCHAPVPNAVLELGPIVYSVCPEIRTQPQPATVMKGTPATLSVDAIGAELRYEWYSIDPATGVQSGTLGTNATFITPPIQQDMEFRVRVYSGSCVQTSAGALVTYCREPRVAWTGGIAQVRANQPQTLQVSITAGEAQLFWYKGTSGDTTNSTLLAGPTVNTTLDIGPAQTTNYWVRAVKPGTSCSDQTTTFTVQVCLPQILQQPQGTLVNAGTLVHLTVNADGGTLTYQWYEGAAGVTTTPVGTNTSSLDVTASTTKSYWVRVTGACGTPVDSDVATVSVCVPPAIAQQPAGTNAQSNTLFTLTVSATGTNLSYQWYQGAAGVTTTPVGDDVPAFTGSAAVTTSYWVKVTGMCGSVNSGAATVSIPPGITTEPASVRVTYNTTATLTVVATGTQLAYQWYSGSGTNQPIAGATSASYVTPPMTADGSFWVRVFSGTQSRNSALAAVTVCPSPNISVSQPSGVAGSAVTLSIANPYPGDTFAWYEGTAPATAVPLGGGTSKTVYPTQTTSYWVRATGATCFADSATRVVTVCYPRIDTHPQGTMINSGSSTTLSVAAAGTPALGYQWYVGDSGNTAVPVPNGTSSSVIVSPVADTTYWVQVRSGAGGSCVANSNAATVTVCNAPSITGQPNSINGQAGVQFTLSVSATGTNLSYQWYQGAAGITTTPVGNNAPTFSATVNSTTDYWVKVTGTCGTVSSATAKVSIQPGITTEPASVRITSNTTATLSVVATGAQLTYQWYRGSGTNDPVAGATAASYTTPQLIADTSYWVRVASGTQSRNSALATVSICAAPNVSVSQPSTVAGSTVTLTVTNPYPGDTFAWYQGNAPATAVPLGGGTSRNVAPTQTTSYWVRATSASCFADSATKVVTVCYPRIDSQPQSTGIAHGGSATLSVTAVGTPALTYQWYAGNSGDTSAPILNATSSSVTVSPASQTTYWVQVRSAAGGSCATNSNAATVSVCDPPVITQQPSSVVVSAQNATATIGVSATGDGLHYAWFRGPVGTTTTPMGDDSPILSIPVSYTYDYWVRVTGTCGVVNSNSAKISVPATINSEPADVSVCKGSSTTLSISAFGNELSYQWYQGAAGNYSTPLGTATTQIVSPIVNTTYWCEVKSGQAPKASRGALVTVKASPTINNITKTPMGSCTRLQVFVPSADVGKVTYTWYFGSPGDTTNLVWNGTTFDACTNGTYWVRVQYNAANGSCATNSSAVVVP